MSNLDFHPTLLYVLGFSSMYVCVLCSYSAQSGQKRVLDPLDLEITPGCETPCGF